mgnify:CR=1 FL=1
MFTNENGNNVNIADKQWVIFCACFYYKVIFAKNSVENIVIRQKKIVVSHEKIQTVILA